MSWVATLTRFLFPMIEDPGCPWGNQGKIYTINPGITLGGGDHLVQYISVALRISTNYWIQIGYAIYPFIIYITQFYWGTLLFTGKISTNPKNPRDLGATFEHVHRADLPIRPNVEGTHFTALKYWSQWNYWNRHVKYEPYPLIYWVEERTNYEFYVHNA